VDSEAPPDARHEDFAARISDVLRLGWLGHFSAGSSVLVELRDAPTSKTGERALCRALLALVFAALDDLPAARRLARQAIHDTARPPAATPPDKLRLLRLARALATNASVLVGDVVRGRRAAQARFVADDPESEWLVRAGTDLPWQNAPGSVERYVKFVDAVHRRYAQRRRPGPLTSREVLVLEHVAAGRSPAQTAALVGRSTHTVRTQIRNAYAKLGAHGREDALAEARALGLLDRGGQPQDRSMRTRSRRRSATECTPSPARRSRSGEKEQGAPTERP
jgi:DNA-binding CsgD family transcriptional regulator